VPAITDNVTTMPSATAILVLFVRGPGEVSAAEFTAEYGYSVGLKMPPNGADRSGYSAPEWTGPLPRHSPEKPAAGLVQGRFHEVTQKSVFAASGKTNPDFP
jgi:hypothetical protein